MTDVCWSQRFKHFEKAYSQLQEALDLMTARELSNIEKQGAIHTFEFTFELACDVLKQFLVWQGYVGTSDVRDVICESFKCELISDGHAWLAMLQDRQRTVHTYNKETATDILNQLRYKYSKLFAHFFHVFSKKRVDLARFLAEQDIEFGRYKTLTAKEHLDELRASF